MSSCRSVAQRSGTRSGTPAFSPAALASCLVVMAVTACAQAHPERAVTSGSVALAPSASIDTSPVCAALQEASGYRAPSALAPDFSRSTHRILEVTVAPVRYASRPERVPDGVPVQLGYALNDDDELELTLCVWSAAGATRAHAGTFGSEGGRHAVAQSIFMADADADPQQELVVLLGWAVDNALDTSGTFYAWHVYDIGRAGGQLQRLTLEDEPLVSGFDGVREGEPVTYPLRDERAFKAYLQDLQARRLK